MSSSPDQIKEELLHIEIAVELDQGKSTNEVAEKFGIKLLVVKAIAKIIGADQPQIKKTVKSRRFSEAEREVLVGRIEAGETVEDLGAEAGVTENTLRRWCKLRGITPPRILEQISLTEQREIRELLEERVWQDIAQAYNVSRDAIEELKEPAHRQLDTETLSYLFELLREQPAAAAKKLCGIAKEAGLDIPENAVSSYRKRLKSLNII